MRDAIAFVGATLVIFACSPTLYADPPHGRGLPPGLQKKYERGDKLPPGWAKKSPAYEYGYYEPFDDRYEQFEDQYEPLYLEDKVYQIIKDVRDLTDPYSQ